MARRLTVIVGREGDGYVVLCPEVDVASQGDSVAEARRNLEEAVALFFETASREERFAGTRSRQTLVGRLVPRKKRIPRGGSNSDHSSRTGLVRSGSMPGRWMICRADCRLRVATELTGVGFGLLTV